MKKPLFYIFLILVFLSSCRDDINDIMRDVEEDDFVVFVQSTVRGQVVDESGLPLSNVSLQISGETTTSDADGNFHFDKVDVKKEGGDIVIARGDGFFEGVSHANFTAEGSSFLEVRLMEKGNPDRIDPSSEQVISKTNGLKITVPQNSIIDADGLVHEGTVQVFSRWIDPTDENVGGIMPGALTATDANGDEKVLATYGMLALDLESEFGEKLELKPGDELTVEMPIPSELEGDAPDEMPLWEYDLEEGKWLEKGVCKKLSSSYICNIPNSGIWNCDVPLEAICLSAKVLNMDLTPASFLKVVVEDLTDNFIYWGYTDEEGFFCGSVPEAAPLLMTILDHCDNVLYTAEIGPFSMDTDLEDIILEDDVSEFQINVMGSMALCQNTGQAIGHLAVRYPGTLTIFPIYETESYDVDIALKCTDFPSIELTAYSTLEMSSTVTTTVNMDNDVDLGLQNTCEDLTDYFGLVVDGVSYFTSPTQYYLRPNQTTDWLILEGLSAAGTFTMELRDYQGVGAYDVNAFFKTENGHLPPGFDVLDAASPDISVNVTEDDGEFITGNYSGVALDELGNSRTISGDFIIKRGP